MSGILQRLLARATGEVGAGGLRPRLAGRFEMNADVAPASFETHDEHHRAPRQPPDAASEETAQQHLLGDGTPARGKQGLYQTAPKPSTPAPTLALTRAVNTLPGSRRGQAPPTETGHGSGPASRLPTAFPIPTRDPSSAPDPGASAPNSRHSTDQTNPDHRLSKRVPAPDPLLSEGPPGTIITASSTDRKRSGHPTETGAGVPQASKSSAAAEHDIHIHIGRLELRTAPTASPGRPRHKLRESHITSLSDYLKGNGA
jgi:hypothetical protein